PAFSSLVITLTLLLSLFSSSIIPRHPSSPLFPYTTLFRSLVGATVQLTTTLKDAAGNVLSGRSVTWASGTPAVATESSTGLVTGDRKSTRLNSSHVSISYAVFCLKKKKKKKKNKKITSTNK